MPGGLSGGSGSLAGGVLWGTQRAATGFAVATALNGGLSEAAKGGGAGAGPRRCGSTAAVLGASSELDWDLHMCIGLAVRRCGSHFSNAHLNTLHSIPTNLHTLSLRPHASTKRN